MSFPTSRPAPRIWPRLGEFGWGRRLAIMAAALIGSAAFAYGANIVSRAALWQVVRACVFDQATTGSPLPCLKVSDDYVVLRPPIGRPDTILSPTQAIVGLEDPRLQAPDTPNYFALAWGERGFIGPGASGERVALAVNSRLARTQDQLHVHMGCLARDFARRIDAGALGPKTGVWFRAADMAPGLELWTYRTGANTWARLEPFRLLKDLYGDASAMKRTTLGVVSWKGEFIAVALHSRPGGWYAAAEDMIRSRC